MRGKPKSCGVALRCAVAALIGCMTFSATACGFGRYNEEATQNEISANDGIAGHGQWWPWACANGGMPAAQSPNLNYLAAGTCGTGGPFVLSVDGCQMNGTWGALGLSGVTTTVASSYPEAGGWQVKATPSGHAQANCTADAPSPIGELTFTCQTADDAATVVCTSTLTPVNG